MKRFIDLRQHEKEGVGRFAWFDTVRDRFETFSDGQTWCCWQDFEIDYTGNELERYRALTPIWAFDCGESEDEA